MTNKIKLNGWQPDPKGDNYPSFRASSYGNIKSTAEVDLRIYSSPRHDQRDTNTCVAQSCVKALEIKRIIKHGRDKHIDLSIADLYYGARDLMNPKETHLDEGTFISLACEVLKRYGVVREKSWPLTKDSLFKAPPILVTREAALNKIKSQFKITSTGPNRVDDIIKNLQANNPVIFGTQVGKNWLNYKGGKEPIRPIDRIDWQGGHCMTIVGYVRGCMIVENSWGTKWGEEGFAYVAPEVFMDARATSDIWVIVDGSEAWVERK